MSDESNTTSGVKSKHLQSFKRNFAHYIRWYSSGANEEKTVYYRQLASIEFSMLTDDEKAEVRRFLKFW